MKNDLYLIKRDSDLTKMVREVFGSDLILAGYYSHRTDLGGYEFNPEFHAEYVLKPERARAKDTNASYDIDTSSADIIVEFKNGRRVHFSNSEWATITLLKDVNYKEF